MAQQVVQELQVKRETRWVTGVGTGLAVWGGTATLAGSEVGVASVMTVVGAVLLTVGIGRRC